tara:strand:- start:828 stop:1106 length:279 start_codon:yes stop_codon:yes gene_type:complete
MKTVFIKHNFERAVQAFNNQLNDYYEKDIANDRPYFGNGAMLDYLSELEDALNDGTDLTFELGKKTRRGSVATFEPCEAWKEKYLLVEEVEV